MLLSNKWITNEIKELKKSLKTNENKHTATQNLWHTVKAVLREGHSITGLPQEARK